MVDEQGQSRETKAGGVGLQNHSCAPLLPGKLFRPAPRPELVARPRLLDELRDGRQSGRPLTLIVAPAGYGKSTLTAAWALELAQRDNVAIAWLTLDKNDNDPSRFFTYLAASLSDVAPRAGESIRHLLAVLPQPAPDSLMLALLRELAIVPGHSGGASCSLLLVMDDYQHLQAPGLHDAVRLLVENCPAALHVALVTREDPALPLSRWRVGDLVTEIRARELRFTEDEAAHFLERRAGQRLEQQLVAALTQRTEGWAAGLQLAALALRGGREAAAFVQAFRGSHHYVIDYLVEEVLAQLEPAVRNFLQRTAVVDRLCASLCAALLGGDDAIEADQQTMLEYLEEANLFLVPLDDGRRWYRYHQLFADCLRAELNADERAEGHRRAAAWFAKQERYDEAIGHAVAAGATVDVARLVRLAAEPAFQRGDVGQLAKWMEHLPKELLFSDPQLGVYWMLSLILTGRSQEVPGIISMVEGHSNGWTDRRQRARLLTIKAWMADITDSKARTALALQAAGALSKDDPLFCALIAVPLGHAYLFEDHLEEAVATFREGLALAPMRGASFDRLSLLGNLVHALNLQGRRREAWAVCQQVIDEFVDSRGDPLSSAGIPYILRGWLNYQANNLSAARADAAHGSELMRLAFQDTLLTALEFQLPALLYEAAGEPEQALVTVREGRERAARQRYEQAVRAANQLEADLLLRHGQLAGVRHWAMSLAARGVRTGMSNKQRPAGEPVYDLSYVTYVRLLLAEGHHGEARRILSQLAELSRAGERGCSLITILLLQAVVGQEPEPHLLEAVQRAAGEEYRRLIIDECAFPAHGPQLKALLRRDHVRRTAPAFVKELLEALADEKALAPAAAVLKGDDAPKLVEPLTEQERAVLQLLVSGLSNHEIAAELMITLGTAKWHVHNVYGKLGVGSRVDAVLRAQELELG